MIQFVQVKPPKDSRPTLEYTKDTFVVRNGLLFDYYPMKASVLIPDKIFNIIVSPPILTDGYACLGKEIYEVSKQDLMKRKVYVSKQYSNRGSSTQPEQSVPNPPKQELDNSSGIEIDEDANLAWENQIDSLLQNLTAKTGEHWEVSYNP